jgi:nucleoside-diphosphate-sugar epimerase
MKIAVTGTTGFVGNRYMRVPYKDYEKIPLNLRSETPDQMELQGVNTIVHIAGKAHEMQPIPEGIYFKVNYDLTKALADKAKAAGVSHFIYISSTKVYGDEINGVVNEDSECFPVDAYGKSKRMSEEYLLSMQSPEFTVSIVRPPLVYGPGVKGNMIRLLELAEKNIPLPFGNTKNARSMVYLDNLIALINHIIEKKSPGIFVGGDASPLATDQLICYMRKSMGKKAGLVTIPDFFRNILKKIKPGMYIRLFGSFEVDNSFTNKTLGFTPPYSSELGIAEMVQWYLKR